MSKIGDIKIRYHRDIPTNTKIKTLTISKEAGKWLACFSFEGIISNEPKLEAYSRSLGIDMGLIYFWWARQDEATAQSCPTEPVPKRA